ncbi:hypothetical protein YASMINEVIRUS_1501, partial [Yasminevirus sp. GU-2018]
VLLSTGLFSEPIMFKIENPINDFREVTLPFGVTNVIASGLGLRSLRGLPEGITDLDVSNNLLDDLDLCPKTVRNFRVSKNRVKTLDQISDVGIRALGVSYNHLTNFKGAPKTLESVVAVSNFLNSLEGLSQEIKFAKLYVSYNKLESMEHSPIADILDCSCNLLKNFDHIKEGVRELIISNNPFDVIDLRSCPRSVELLRCSSCNVKSLANYPPKLKVLEALKNQIGDFSSVRCDTIEVFCD